MAASSSKQHKRFFNNLFLDDKRGELPLEDAVRYMNEVAEKLDDKKTVDTFFNLIKNFIADRVDGYEVIVKVHELLEGHPDLLQGFIAFLPEDVDVLSILRKKAEEEAVSLVLRVERRFRKNKTVYNRFLNILNQYNDYNKPVNEVYQEVRVLFHGHEDLFEQFKKFMPSCTPGVENKD
ncbi:hypothetical protein AQUCO_00200365v1 [Aquilegia coerulea]|uniref:Histone deacetylase interacting domain-containing protein n=1 Tax=Aquilegia coerulea TaxID=218851 RepID=A0A2G5F2V2_AQUCA|nr:hypothetical protein AQUCO_00200365v1 [Aquilegia coerulea]